MVTESCSVYKVYKIVHTNNWNICTIVKLVYVWVCVSKLFYMEIIEQLIQINIGKF